MGWVEHQRRRLSKDPAEREQGVPWDTCGDKLKAYDFAESVGVAAPMRLAVWRKPDEFDPAELPDWFVLKPKGMHSTNGVIPAQRMGETFKDLLRGRVMTAEEIRAEQVTLYERNQYKTSYRLFAEELLIPESGEIGRIPFDYKFYCFADRVEYITQIDRSTKPPRLAWFGPEFDAFDVEANLESDWTMIQRGEPQRPRCWRALIDAARKLSLALKTPFVSVDMYATLRGPVLGELTLSPGGPYHGRMYRFKPHFDAHLGKLWEAASPNPASP